MNAVASRPRILAVGTLDTKGEEFAYLRGQIEARGAECRVLDMGIMGTPSFAGDITRDEVLRRAGLTVSELSDGTRRGDAISAAISGARTIVEELYAAGEVDGVIAMGGGSGTTMGKAILTALPLGVPKVLVTTLSNVNPVIQGTDIVILRSIVDLVGLNSITTTFIQHAAGAITGMAAAPASVSGARKSVVITCLGVTTPGVMALRRILLEQGHEVIVLHRRTVVLDTLLDAGLVEAVIDFTPSEITEPVVFPGNGDADARLRCVREAGVPLITCAGGLDMIIQLVPADRRADELRDRPFIVHSPTATLIRTTVEEQRRIGAVLGAQLNGSTGRAAAVVPMGGFSMWDDEGKAFRQPDARRAFADALRGNAGSRPVIEVDANINDERYVRAVVDTLIALLEGEGVHDSE